MCTQDDYRRTITELDEKEFISLRLVIIEMRNHYVSCLPICWWYRRVCQFYNLMNSVTDVKCLLSCYWMWVWVNFATISVSVMCNLASLVRSSSRNVVVVIAWFQNNYKKYTSCLETSLYHSALIAVHYMMIFNAEQYRLSTWRYVILHTATSKSA